MRVDIGSIGGGLQPSEQVSDRLVISRRTVKNLRAHIMQKLNIHTTHERIR